MNKNPILNALIWAGLMIAVAFIVKDSEKSGTITLLMLAGWVATGGLSEGFRKAECQAFNKMIGKKMTGKS